MNREGERERERGGDRERGRQELQRDDRPSSAGTHLNDKLTDSL